MTRLQDMVAAAVHLDRLPPDSFIRIGHDGDGPDPAVIRCDVVGPDGTLGTFRGDTFEDAARAAADLFQEHVTVHAQRQVGAAA